MATTARLQSAQWRQVFWLSVGAIAIYVLMRLLPTGTNLHQGDFRVEGGSQLQFCDPADPQFVPVVAVRSPIVTELRALTPVRQGEPVDFVLSLHTASGKPIGPDDLLVSHTRKLHLMVVNPTLDDYQHIHPVPGEQLGEWSFQLAPQFSGTYRVFADFTPAATGRSLYGSADFVVPGEVVPRPHPLNWSANHHDVHYELTPDVAPIRARKSVKLMLTMTSLGGGPVKLEPVMDAYAHLVAFDEERAGFAHLHPQSVNPLEPPEDLLAPKLHFMLTIPTPGRYVIWTQVAIAGEEHFTPFWFEVLP